MLLGQADGASFKLLASCSSWPWAEQLLRTLRRRRVEAAYDGPWPRALRAALWEALCGLGDLGAAAAAAEMASEALPWRKSRWRQTFWAEVKGRDALSLRQRGALGGVSPRFGAEVELVASSDGVGPLFGVGGME